MIMLALAFAVVCGPFQDESAQDKKDPDSVKVTLDCENASIGEILESLKLISGIPIELDAAAQKKVDPAIEKVSLKLQDTILTDALKLLFGPRGLEVTVVDKKKVLITVPK
jgi:hypothetical protein